MSLQRSISAGVQLPISLVVTLTVSKHWVFPLNGKAIYHYHSSLIYFTCNHTDLCNVPAQEMQHVFNIILHIRRLIVFFFFVHTFIYCDLPWKCVAIVSSYFHFSEYGNVHILRVLSQRAVFFNI